MSLHCIGQIQECYTKNREEMQLWTVDSGRSMPPNMASSGLLVWFLVFLLLFSLLWFERSYPAVLYSFFFVLIYSLIIQAAILVNLLCAATGKKKIPLHW
jgi:hypothetical protein